MKNMVKTESDTTELKRAVENFIGAMDKGELPAITNSYDCGFLNVRITDQNGVIRINRDEMIHMLSNWNRSHVETQSTTIHHLEVLSDMGFVLLDRIKDLENGWEPVFYCHLWNRENSECFFCGNLCIRRACQITKSLSINSGKNRMVFNYSYFGTACYKVNKEFRL